MSEAAIDVTRRACRRGSALQRILTLASLYLALAVSASASTPEWSNVGGADADSMIVVAVAEKADPSLAAGATPRGYDSLPAYTGSERSIAAARRLAKEYGLSEVAAWTIEPLQLRCMVYRVDNPAERDRLLQRLRDDRRVRIAQPLQEFRTLDQPEPAPKQPASGTSPASAYNDPYLGLQTNFTTVQAESAQRWSRGDGSRIAVIDTAVDASHPDLAGRIVEQQDLVANADDDQTTSAADQQHGTEVAGVIAALANNGIGIVGLAPSAQILSYRACWASAAFKGARCNSYTLALALAAAIAADVRIINLSLGGPADPLLQQLLEHALHRGVIVVGAIPPNGRRDGFPVALPGVVAVASSDDESVEAGTLRAPGTQILSLQPGGHYDYASGSSLAAAQVSAAIALMLQLRPNLDAKAAQSLLLASREHDGGSINLCRALAALRGAPDSSCATPAAGRSEGLSRH